MIHVSLSAETTTDSQAKTVCNSPNPTAAVYLHSSILIFGLSGKYNLYYTVKVILFTGGYLWISGLFYRKNFS